MSVEESLNAAISGLDPIELSDLQARADLQTRQDLKYIVSPTDFVAVLANVAQLDRPPLRALEIDGRRDFAYESTYFDTPELASYLAAAHDRRRRFKIRTRSYLDVGECLLEVKTAGGRGETVKARSPYALGSRRLITADGREFLRDRGIPDAVVRRLAPTLTTHYYRSTLLDHVGARVTIDSALVCRNGDGAELELRDAVLVETKSIGVATVVDRLLWAAGHRPVRVSKYASGLAAITPGLPANRWNRTLRRHFGWLPLAVGSRV